MGNALIIIGLLIIIAACVLGFAWTQQEPAKEPETIPLWTPPKNTEKKSFIDSIREEYPNAIITETDDKIIVDIQITLPKPVEKIHISGVVKP